MRLLSLLLLLIAATTGGGPSPAQDVSDDRHRAAPVKRPEIEQRRIPYDARRRSEMAAYARRHYGIDTFRLVDPRVIVQHFTANDSFAATYEAFAHDDPDPEFGELPNVCAHFVVDRDGAIYQLVTMKWMCRHTVGLNYTAIGIEHVGNSDAEILGNGRQLRASLRLTRWLRCKKHISVRDVIGHNENRDSRFHRERVSRFKDQTHGDWTRASMRVYRRKLRRLGGC